MYHYCVFLLCPTTLGFQLEMLLFSILGGNLSLKADLCQKMLTGDLALQSTLKV